MAEHTLESLAGGLEPLAEVPALGSRVHGKLEGLIVSRALPPGARLVEGDLAKTLGVSRGPIREALQILARDGFVELRPRQGAFVRVPSQDEVENFYDVRRVLEVEAARLAATRITPAGAAALKQCLSAGAEVLAAGDDPSEISPSIHEIIRNIAANPTLSSFLELVGRRSAWYLSPFHLERRRKAWREHEEIAEDIIAGDAARAQDAMKRHIDGALESYQPNA
jgi:DNA-binding GntR family transcriptional regulator